MLAGVIANNPVKSRNISVRGYNTCQLLACGLLFGMIPIVSYLLGWDETMDEWTTWMVIILIHYIIGRKGIPILLSNCFHPCTRTVTPFLGWFIGAPMTSIALFCCYFHDWINHNGSKSSWCEIHRAFWEVSYFQAFISYHIPDLAVVHPDLLPRKERTFVGFFGPLSIWYLFPSCSGYQWIFLPLSWSVVFLFHPIVKKVWTAFFFVSQSTKHQAKPHSTSMKWGFPKRDTKNHPTHPKLGYDQWENQNHLGYQHI